MPLLYALDSHKLMRGLEDINARIIVQASLARKAGSLPLGFQRIDYPDLDPGEWNRYLTMKLENGRVKTGFLPMTFRGNMKEQYEAHNRDYIGVYKEKYVSRSVS